MKIEGTSIQIEGTADAKVLRQKKAWAVSREQQGNQCCIISEIIQWNKQDE